MAGKNLTDNMVKKLEPKAKRYTVPDPLLRGHYVRVTPKGVRSFVAVARDPYGKQIWATLGGADVLEIDEAREQARTAIKRIKGGLSAKEPPPVKPDSFEAVAENYLNRHVKRSGLRSQAEIERILSKYILPFWRDRVFIEIKRSDVAKLLDVVEDDHGGRQADYVLAVIRGLMNWFATRDDDYLPPIARGMRRTDPKARQRSRTLSDDDLRLVWAAAEQLGPYGAMVRLALLTGQRRQKIVSIKWTDITIDGTWRIAAEDREKGTAGELLLPPMALNIILSQPRIVDNEHVFAGRFDGHFTAFSRDKKHLDTKISEIAKERGADPVEPWVFHDARRTARSLLSRAGVRPDIAERVLGHAITGVAAVYDRHSYTPERADALTRLAGLIELILEDRGGDNVVELRAGE